MIPPIAGFGAVRPLGAESLSLPGAAPATGEGSFASLLARAVNDTVDRLNTAEQVSVQAIQGKADTREVVDAVMSAEQALQAATAIRDKIVSAYMEISRMAI